eukprot:SAG22_NODE_20921_length_261_cov_0.962963_1_plen_28_part_10
MHGPSCRIATILRYGFNHLDTQGQPYLA